MRRCQKNLIVLLLIVIVSAALLQPAAAAPSASVSPGDWLELRSKAFSIIFPSDYQMLATVLLTSYGETLDNEYQRFAAAFDAELPLPVTIRIYPEELDYYSLNVLAPRLAPGATHSHIGAREIALIGVNVTANLARWQVEGLNAFRYELAVLFTRQVSENKAPPGLMAGVGGYAQDPNDILGASGISGLLPAGMKLVDLKLSHTWEMLWANEELNLDLLQLLQATTTVAYLVDMYGWPTLVQFLKSLSTASGYQSALEATYKLPFTGLRERWLVYFPLFTGGRWQYDVLYHYDLSPFEQLLQASGYSSAIPGLNDAAQLLKKLNNQPDTLDQANRLLERARLGQSAAALALQSRQAFQNSDYTGCISLANEAEAKYQDLGDNRRLAELDAYRGRAKEILTLRDQVLQLTKNLSALDSQPAQTILLAQTGQKLGALGDLEWQKQVEVTLQSLALSRQQWQWKLALSGVLLAVLFLLIRILIARHAPPLEATL